MNSDFKIEQFKQHGFFVQEEWYAGGRIVTPMSLDFYMYNQLQNECREQKAAIILGGWRAVELLSLQRQKYVSMQLSYAASAAKKLKQHGHAQILAVETLMDEPITYGGRQAVAIIKSFFLYAPYAASYDGLTTGFPRDLRLNDEISALVLLRQDNRTLNKMVEVYLQLLQTAMRSTVTDKNYYGDQYILNLEILANVLSNRLHITLQPRILRKLSNAIKGESAFFLLQRHGCLDYG